jgi:triosephosphate isomerase
MQKLIVANWKENPSSEARALTLFKAVAKIPRKSGVEIVICPPFLFLEEIAEVFRSIRLKKNFAIGAQDVFWKETGAFTGAVGPKMVRSLGAEYVIIGHSERRNYFHETDAMVNRKIKVALQDGLHVILCVGEPLSVRKKGIAAAKKFIKSQLKKDLAQIKTGKLTVAYEPIWAIGTGKNDSPKDAADIARFIKKELSSRNLSPKVRVLYGGSVNSGDIRDYVQYKEIDGALVGGASLKAAEFKKMIERVSKK